MASAKAKPSAPQTLENKIDEYVARYLPTDVKTWVAGFKKDKIIHDALWGTFQLQRHEVALLDTPLIQRLRYLHQTGAVYLTYPSAHHTRFEHTLGVLCQTGRLCAALRSREGENRIDAGYINDARFAALLHDTGHGPFSHTSEQYFSGMPEISNWKKQNPNFESGAGEILSYLIILSEPFREFVDRLNEHFKINLNYDRIAGIITGTLPAKQMFMSEIVHGPFDADKLDYMPRDGMFSGLKMHVDIDRLFHSIRIKTAEIKTGKDDKQTQTRIAGSVTGLSPLTQIMFNRMLLYTGMYHHHKVRAVDCMLWAIFHLATSKGATVGGILLEDPTSFLSLTDDRVLMPELTDSEEIRRIIISIRHRRLWRKAIVIARNTVPPEMHEKIGKSPQPRFVGIATLAGNHPSKIRLRREIASEIWETAKKPCQEYEVWLDCPKPPNVEEAKRMWIDSDGDGEPRILNDYIPVEQWVQLYGTHQSRFHVFCPPEAVKAIGEAAIEVFRKRFQLEFLPEATAV